VPSLCGKVTTVFTEMLPEGVDRAGVAETATRSQDVCYILQAFNVDAKTWRRRLQDDLLDDANDVKVKSIPVLCTAEVTCIALMLPMGCKVQ